MVYKQHIMNIGIVLAFISCAGPYTPFGRADNYLDSYENVSHPLVHSLEHQAYFDQRGKLYHRSFDVSFTAIDSDISFNDYEFYFLYNDKIISKDLLDVHKENNQIRVSFNKLKLNPEKDHDIIAVFRTAHKTSIVQLSEPHCSLYVNKSFETLDSFEVNQDLVQDINRVASTFSFNQTLLASLVAVESSFNLQALSYAKAIGLTQMTSIAEKEIISKYPEWPMYNKINKMSFQKIRHAIKTNEINKDNEWRLDPVKSLTGGAEYLEYLKRFWFSKNSQSYLKKYLKDYPGVDYNALILASYNSGVGNVRRALREKKNLWQNHKKLKEAKKYVRKINGLCMASI